MMTARESLNMPLEEAMRTQRAIRRFRPDPVDDELVLHLIELALKAPTGGNAQNWRLFDQPVRPVLLARPVFSLPVFACRAAAAASAPFTYCLGGAPKLVVS